MVAASSSLDNEAIAKARALLEPPVRKERMWQVVAAAAVAALAALSFATAMVLAPPLVTEHTVQSID